MRESTRNLMKFVSKASTGNIFSTSVVVFHCHINLPECRIFLVNCVDCSLPTDTSGLGDRKTNQTKLVS